MICWFVRARKRLSRLSRLSRPSQPVQPVQDKEKGLATKANPFFLTCRERDSNPHSCNSQGILSPSCLPFHHRGNVDFAQCGCKGRKKMGVCQIFALLIAKHDGFLSAEDADKAKRTRGVSHIFLQSGVTSLSVL